MPGAIARRRRLGGVTTLDLRALPGLALWLKADSISAADGASVATWSDSSGNGRDATQATGGKQPLYKVARLNGLPGVNFTSASSQTLQVASLPLTSWTVFVVEKLSGTAGLIMEQSANANTTSGMYIHGNGVSSMLQSRANGASRDGSSFASTANWSTDNVARVVTASYNGTSATLLGYWNGVAQSLTVDRTETAGISLATAALNIGSRNQASGFLTGDLFEIAIYSPLLSLGNQLLVEAALRRKWGTP